METKPETNHRIKKKHNDVKNGNKDDRGMACTNNRQWKNLLELVSFIAFLRILSMRGHSVKDALQCNLVFTLYSFPCD